MHTRTTEIMIDDNFLPFIGDHASHAFAAIGYLTAWALHSERYSGKLTIYADRRGEISATYRNPAGETTYTMLAVQHGDGPYSTHS